MKPIGVCPKCHHWLTEEEPFCPKHGITTDWSVPPSDQSPSSPRVLPSTSCDVGASSAAPARTRIVFKFLRILLAVFAFYTCFLLGQWWLYDRKSRDSQEFWTQQESATSGMHAMRQAAKYGTVYRCPYCGSPVNPGAEVCQWCRGELWWQQEKGTGPEAWVDVVKPPKGRK